MEQCERCSRSAETAWSCAAGATVCEACHFEAAPPAAIPASAWRAPRRREPKLEPYTRLVYRVWDALAEAGAVCSTFDRRVIVGTCPSCRIGVLAVRFIDAEPPKVRTGGCSAGCSAAHVVRTFK